MDPTLIQILSIIVNLSNDLAAAQKRIAELETLMAKVTE